MKAITEAHSTPTPELADDLLEGADQIAEFVFGDPKLRRRVYHLASSGKDNDKLPIFRLGSTICARKSTLLRWIATREGELST